MTTEWKYAALSELIYRRNDLDQSIKVENIDTGFRFVAANRLSLDSQQFSVDQENFLYNDSGFEAAVVQSGDDFIVVFRGTDTAVDTEELIAAGVTAFAAGRVFGPLVGPAVARTIADRSAFG